MTTSDVQQFQRDGYFIDRGAFSHDDLEQLRPLAESVQRYARERLPDGTRYWFGNKGQRREMMDRLGLDTAQIDAAQAADGDDPKARKAAFQAAWEGVPDNVRGDATWGVNEITRPEMFHPELVNVLGLPRVREAMDALLDEPRAWGIKMLWTPKVVGYDLGWHRDQMKPELYDYAHTKPARQDHVQFNAALEEDRCFLVVPGSHRRPLSTEEWRALREDATAELTGQVVAELEPGDILYMDAHALHRGRSALGEQRLTLHYSCQAQWVPLRPWGDPEHFDWITSDAFLNQISPTTRPVYERLRTAERTDDAMAYLKQAAQQAGWRPAA